ncbi:unnamed protein product, partial [Adineta steineri]
LVFVIHRLIERARNAIFFSIDTETDDSSKKPAIIQIELIKFKHNIIDMDEEEKRTIVIFEMCHLPLNTFLT